MTIKPFWFPKLKEFREKLQEEIDSSEEDLDTMCAIRLPDVLLRAEKIVLQIRKWAKLLAKIKRFNGHLENEFEALDSELFINTKQELVLKQDDRKKKGLKVYAFTDQEVKMKRASDPKRLKRLQDLQKLRAVENYIESACYWPSIKAMNTLEIVAKFSVASEREYK